MLMRRQSSPHRWIYTAAQSQTKPAGVSAWPVRAGVCACVWAFICSAFVSVGLCHFFLFIYVIFIQVWSQHLRDAAAICSPANQRPHWSSASRAALAGSGLEPGSCCARRLQQHWSTKEAVHTGVSLYLLGLQCSQGTWYENIRL